MSPHFTGVNDDRTEFKYVGIASPVGRQSYDMAKGVAKYPRDMTKDGMVYARALRCPYGHAKVEVLDTSAAEALEGVIAVICWDDEDLQKYPVGWKETGMLPFLSDQADYAGDECGAIVVARTDELCKEALDLIELRWTVLPHTIDIRDSAALGAPILRPEYNTEGNIGGTIYGKNISEKGNVVEGFAQADHIIEFDFGYPNFTAFIAMPQAYLAYSEPDPFGNASYGEMLYVNGGTDVMDHVGIYSNAWIQLGLSMDEVRQTSPYCGGKYCMYSEQRGTGLAPYLSRRLKRPVRYVYTRRDAFNGCGKSIHNHLRLGFTSQGVITAVQLHDLEQTGVSYFSNRVDAPVNYSTGSSGFLQATKCENVYTVIDQLFTNATLTLTDAGAGACDLVNIAFDHIAETLDMDPIDVALLNLKDSAMFSLEQCMIPGMEAFGWKEKHHAPGTRTLPDGRLHGASMSIAWQSHGQGERYNINLALKSDGKVYLPYNEMILGIYWPEMLQLVIAEEVGMKLEDVIVYYSPHYPNWNPGSSNDHASSATYCAKEAAANLKKAILANAFVLLGASSPDDVDLIDSMLVLKSDPTKTVPVKAADKIMMGQITAWSDTNSPLRPALEELACMNIDFCEVAVDQETGEVEILDYVMTHDYGKVFRPSSAQGQIDLHAIMLTGISKLEEVVFDKNTGVLLNGNLIDYKVPTRLDTTPLKYMPIESRNGYGAYGSVSNGHSHLNRNITTAAVANAIGSWVEVPFTSDKILRALGKIKVEENQ
jgi:CO/xanthine dehydrogenase Mo-binding subunit